jgi:hypothetical protein
VFLFNTYRGWVPLIIADSKEILYSKEGVAQGDPLSMFAYAVATIPLINQVGHPRDGSEIWYADDASACAQLRNLRDWFVRLQQIGPSFGYYPEPSKCVIIVNSALIPLAHMLFDQFGVKITTIVIDSLVVLLVMMTAPLLLSKVVWRTGSLWLRIWFL